MPRFLTAGAMVLVGWVLIRSAELWTGIVPALVVGALVPIAQEIWKRRKHPWHDWTVILLLLPAIFAAVWIGVGGLLLDVERADSGRLLYEVGPGIGLTGLLCVLISYHGRHHP